MADQVYALFMHSGKLKLETARIESEVGFQSSDGKEIRMLIHVFESPGGTWKFYAATCPVTGSRLGKGDPSKAAALNEVACLIGAKPAIEYWSSVMKQMEATPEAYVALINSRLTDAAGRPTVTYTPWVPEANTAK